MTFYIYIDILWKKIQSFMVRLIYQLIHEISYTMVYQMKNHSSCVVQKILQTKLRVNLWPYHLHLIVCTNLCIWKQITTTQIVSVTTLTFALAITFYIHALKFLIINKYFLRPLIWCFYFLCSFSVPSLLFT